MIEFKAKKQNGEKIVMLTAYDKWTAQYAEAAGVDLILVGDSLAMVVHGFDSTLHATLEMMQLHTSAVARSTQQTKIVADMPFGSFKVSNEETLKNAMSLMRAGAHAVKLEGADGNIDAIRRLVDAGVPVQGHLGLTPQSVHQLGGHKVQGKTGEAAERMAEDAYLLQRAGCFSLVLEAVPADLAKNIAHEIEIPVIGIGAGPHIDGQVLVIHDALGFDMSFKPKFLKRFAETQPLLVESLKNYVHEVRSGEFPTSEQSYS